MQGALHPASPRLTHYALFGVNPLVGGGGAVKFKL